MPIYNETFAETWEKVDRINSAKKLLRENGYEVKPLTPKRDETNR